MSALILKELKDELDRDAVAEVLTALGYEIDRTYKLKLRDEKTPSASIAPNGYIKDFGNDWGGDIFDVLITFHEYTMTNAKQFVFDILGTTPTASYASKKKKEKTISTEDIQKEFDFFEHNIPADELFHVIPKWLYEVASPLDRALFDSMVRYDNANKTLLTGCYKSTALEFELIGYKRRRYLGGKWVNRKDTHPNNTALSRVFSDNGTVFVIEGHHDALTAVLLGIDFVMIPTAGYRGEIDALSNRKIVFIVEDEPAYKTMLPLAKSLADTNDVELIQFAVGSKMDLSDYVQGFASIEEAVNGINR